MVQYSSVAKRARSITTIGDEREEAVAEALYSGSLRYRRGGRGWLLREPSWSNASDMPIRLEVSAFVPYMMSLKEPMEHEQWWAL